MKINICLYIICFLLTTGCIDSIAQRTSMPVFPTPIETSQPEKTEDIFPTNMLVLATLTQTPLPEDTQEAIATNIPIHPSPTLTGMEIEDLISSLMAANGNCTKPCFWGLVPGETTIINGIDFITGFRKTVLSGQRESVKYYTTSLTTNGLAISIILWDREGILNNLNVDMGALTGEIPISSLGAFNSQEILEMNGRPTEVSFYLSKSTESPSSNSVGYGYILTYPGFVVEYYEQQIPATSPATVCPLIDSGLVGVKLWLGEAQAYPPVPGVDLGTATTMSVDEFYNIMLSEPDKACFSLDIGVFPP